jgi:hypothetical protein
LVSFLNCRVVLRKWFGLRLLIRTSPAASPLTLMLAWAIFAVATHEPAGASCSSVCAVAVPP